MLIRCSSLALLSNPLFELDVGRCGAFPIVSTADGERPHPESSVHIPNPVPKSRIQVEALAGERITAIASADSHSLAVTAEGGVWSWDRRGAHYDPGYDVPGRA